MFNKEVETKKLINFIREYYKKHRKNKQKYLTIPSNLWYHNKRHIFRVARNYVNYLI